MPLISIITVTYNASATIKRTTQSVVSQSYKDFEWLVVDGASSDDTLSLVRTSGCECLTVVSERDRGLYDAMNKGIRLAKGDYLIFLNAGDSFYCEDSLKLIAEAIGKDPSADVVYGQTILVDATGRYIADRHLRAPESLSFKDFAQGMVVCHQAFVVRRSIAPMFDLSYRYSADYKWCIEVLKRSTNNIYVNATIIAYLYEGLSTVNRRKSLIERFKIMACYYGFFPTLWRHLGFVGRFMKHNRAVKKAVRDEKIERE